MSATFSRWLQQREKSLFRLVTRGCDSHHQDHGAQIEIPRTKTVEKSRFPQCGPLIYIFHPVFCLSLWPVETRCKSPGNQSYASISYPRSGRLPQVQQVMWFSTPVRTQNFASTVAGPFPYTDGGTTFVEALRHRRPKFHRKTQRCRKQTHRRSLL